MTPALIADSLLAAVVAGLPDPPARQVVTTGAPRDPLQGEQVAVGWIRNFVGVPGQPDGGANAQCWGEVVAEYVVRVTRCIATATGQTDTDPGELRRAALQTMADATAVRAALASWHPDGGDVDRAVWIGNPQGFQPQGFGTGFILGVHAAT